MKKGFWLFFILLLFEGALRKWFLPGLATPLLVVRDPVAIWLIYMAWRHRVLKMNIYILGISITAVISFFLTLLIGHGNLPVAVFGLRILIIHFPLIFIFGKILEYEDVVKVGRIMLYLAFPVLLVTIFQFYTPQSSWINRGVGGDMSGSGFSGAMGYFRPSGLFSFVSGNLMFWGLTTAYILYFWLESEKVKRWLLILASASLIIEIPISVSRALFFQVILCLIFVFIILLRKPKYLWKFSLVSIVIGILLALLSQTPIMQTGIEVLATRFASASESEGGLEGTLVNRFLGGLVSAITNSTDLPFWGYGLGLGTNVAAMLLSGGRTFLVSEEEWGRTIGEMGILLGMTTIFIRIALTTRLAIASYLKMKIGIPLPWMLLSAGAISLIQGQWAQPTSLGFSILIGGLLIASLKDPQKQKSDNQI